MLALTAASSEQIQGHKFYGVKWAVTLILDYFGI
jgi:hypothetical protein